LFDANVKLLPCESQNEDERCKYLLNVKARHTLLCSLSEEEISKVHSMIFVKERWGTLALSNEGSKEVKKSRNKLTLLRCQYEMFIVEEN